MAAACRQRERFNLERDREWAQELAIQIALDMGFVEFRGSDGWFYNMIEREGLETAKVTTQRNMNVSTYVVLRKGWLKTGWLVVFWFLCFFK